MILVLFGSTHVNESRIVDAGSSTVEGFVTRENGLLPHGWEP